MAVNLLIANPAKRGTMRRMRATDPIVERQLNVLVVEDSADAADSLALILERYGHHVEIARNGLDALEKIGADHPDAVILDIGLPGMSGYEVAKRIAADRPHKTPLFIAVSGHAREEDRQHSREAGIHAHLAKPADPLEINAILERLGRALAN